MQRIIPTLIASLMVVALAAAPAVGHHDDGKGSITPPHLVELEHEFNNVVAAEADPRSNAPGSFAPCIRGKAADTYPCDKVDMLSHLTLGDLGLSFANDIWGWTDPATKKDYALIGGTEGMVIVDISDPRRPDIVGLLPTHSTEGGPFWRDIKVYADHAYVVSEHDGHGVQVLDLTEVRGVTGDPVEFDETAHYDGIGSAHNININEDTGFAYAVGAAPGTESGCSGGLHMIDISDPDSPSFAGCFSDRGYIHDTQCVIYAGPDAEHHGKEICFNSAAEFFDFSPEGIDNRLSIVDVTDKSDPVELSDFEYANDGYSHQGWLTPDQRYFLHNDELDEWFGQVEGTVTRIFDVTDLDSLGAPVEVDHGTTSIGHNAYTEGRYLYASNYTSGLRIFDTTQVSAGLLPQVAFFDVYPPNDNPTFEGGTWSNYPYFHQKKVVAVSSMERGLFVLQPRLGS